MGRLILLLAGSALWSAAVWSATPDSLTRKLSQLPPMGQSLAADTLRVKLLCERAFQLGESDSAMTLLQEASQLTDKLEWEAGRVPVYNGMGHFLLLKGLTLEAADYLFKAQHYADKYNDRVGKAFGYRYLGDVYLNLKDYHRATSYFQKAATLFYQVRMYNRYLLCLNNVGVVQYTQRNYDQAIGTYRDCLEKNKQYRFPNIQFYLLQNLGSTHKSKGDYEKALYYFRQLASTGYRGSASNKTYNFSEMADIYLRRKQLDQALMYGEMADSIGRKANAYYRKFVYDVNYKIHLERRDYQKALHYFGLLRNLLDSNLVENNKQITALQSAYFLEKQKSEIKILTQQQQREENIRYGLIASVSCFFILIIGLFYSNWRIRKKRREIEGIRMQLAQVNGELTQLNETLEQKVTERTTELSAANETLRQKNREIEDALFKGQTIERKRVASELHDNLGGTLAALKLMLGALEPEQLPEPEQRIYESVMNAMESAYADVRLISHNLMPVELERNGLVAALSKLIGDLNRSRRTQFRMEAQYPPDWLDKKAEMEIYSICLELLHNVLKHAQATEAALQILTSPDELTVRVSDNGIGLAGDAWETDKGMGLCNLRNRLTALNGQLDVQSAAGQGTLITLRVQQKPPTAESPPDYTLEAGKNR